MHGAGQPWLRGGPGAWKGRPTGNYMQKPGPGDQGPGKSMIQEAQYKMLRWIWKLVVALAAIIAAVAWLDHSGTQEYIEIYSDDDEEEDAF